MSKLTDQISYLQGLADGMKLNPEKDSHKLILGILDVLGEVGTAFDALAESHEELSQYVDSIDEDLSDLEESFFGDDEDALGEFDGYGENAGDEEDGDEEADGSEDDESGVGGQILYECPACHETVEIDPEGDDFDENALCPACGKKLFPEIME